MRINTIDPVKLNQELHNIMSLINIGLNIKYQIDVFKDGSNITEFKNIIKREVQKWGSLPKQIKMQFGVGENLLNK